MEPLTPLYTADLFAGLNDELISLLRGLSPEDWERPTVAGAWRVRDVAAHLLDAMLRRVSAARDGHRMQPDGPIDDYRNLVGYLNRLNASWVAVSNRLSPRVLTDLLAWTGPQVAAVMASLPPHEQAMIGVAWAGEERSENWFDTGREYTEHWHHQAQIRDAVGAPGLYERRWLHPVIELCLYALPVAFRGLDRPAGATLVLEVTGDAGGTWSLVRTEGAWKLWRGAAEKPAANARMDGDTAWRLLFNALPAEAARTKITAEGDPELFERLIAARGVMV
jgi:uncharacterized protein (TIGR03083 family)